MANDTETGLDVADIISPTRPPSAKLPQQPTAPISNNSMDVSSFLGNAATVANANTQRIAAGTPGGGSGLATATSAATTMANAKGAISTIDNAAAMQVKADDIAAALRFGTMPGVGNMNVVAISEAIKNDESRVSQMQDSFRQQLASYNEKANVNPLSDPLSWIINQFTLPAEHGKLAGAAAELDAGVASVKQKFDVLHQMYQLTDEAHKQNLFTDAAASTERAVALRQLATAESQFELSKAQFESARIGQGQTQIMLAANQQQFQTAVAVNNAQNQSTETGIKMAGLDIEQQRLSVSQENLRLEGIRTALAQNDDIRKNTQLNLEQERMVLAQKNDLRSAESLVLEKQRFDFTKQQTGEQNVRLDTQLSLDKIRTDIELQRERRADEMSLFQKTEAQLNSQVLSERVEARTEYQKDLDRVTTYYNMNRVLVDQFQLMGDGPLKKFLSEQIINPDIQNNGRAGYDSADSVKKLNTLDIPLPEGVEYTRRLLTGAINDARTKAVGGEIGFRSLAPEIQHKTDQEGIINYVQGQARNIPDSGGLFSPAPLLSTVKIPAVAATTIGQALTPLAAGEERYATKAQDIFATAAMLIKEGKLNPDKAIAEIQQIYTAITAATNDAHQYKRFGFDGLNAASGFRTTVTTGGMYSSSTIVNMTNKADVERVLTRMMKTPTNQDYMDQSKTGILGVAP